MTLFSGRPVTFTDDATLYYDDEVLVTRSGAETWTRMRPVPYVLRDHLTRLELGWSSTLSLAAIREGSVRMKVVQQPVSTREWIADLDRSARENGRPGPGWSEYLAAMERQAFTDQPREKAAYLSTSLGNRSPLATLQTLAARGGAPAVSAREIEGWHAAAATRRTLLAGGLYGGEPVGVERLRWLRQHAVRRSLPHPPPSSTGRRAWGRGQIESDFHDVTLTPVTTSKASRAVSAVRVDTPEGSIYTATFVASAFPSSMPFPDCDPWLAHMDRLPFLAEADLIFDLVPIRKILSGITRRFTMLREQESEAREAGHRDLPHQIEAMRALARDLEYQLPLRRMPVPRGWARFRVEAGSPEDVAAMFETTREHFATVRGSDRGLDLAWPGGAAQVDLTLEGIPGQSARHRSWAQTWEPEVIGIALPQSASGVYHRYGSRVGVTTGRVQHVVRIDPHEGIRASMAGQEVLEQPTGGVLLGNQRSGKSTALGITFDDQVRRGHQVTLIDFHGPLTRLASTDIGGRIRVHNLTSRSGSLDVLSDAVIPGDARTDSAIRAEREALAVDVLKALAWRHLTRDGVEAAIIDAVHDASAAENPGLAKAIRRLRRSRTVKIREVGTVLEHMLTGLPEGDALTGPSDAGPLDTDDVVGTILAAPGVRLPRPNRPREGWNRREEIGSVAFAVATHLSLRMLLSLPPKIMKMLLVDEAHVALSNTAGRETIDVALREGPKRGLATWLATHNAREVSEESIINACSLFLQFRSTAPEEIARACAITRLPDDRSMHRAISTLRNGECLAVLPDDSRERFRWRYPTEALREALNTSATTLGRVA